MKSEGGPLRLREAAPEDRGAGSGELQIRIDCRGRRAVDILAELDRELAAADARRRDPLVVLRDLPLLEDSVVTLIKGISRSVMDHPRPVSFWEASGYTEAFLSAMDARTRGR